MDRASRFGTMVIHEAAYQRLARDFDDLGTPTTPAILADQNAHLFEKMVEMEYYPLGSLPKTGTLSFWFENANANATVKVGGLDVAQPSDVAYLIRERAGRGEDIQPMIAATCEMFVMDANLTALAIPYRPTMQASGDYDAGLQAELQAIGAAIHAA